MPLNDQDLQQIVAAIKGTDEFQWIGRKMAEEQGAGMGQQSGVQQPEPDGDETLPTGDTPPLNPEAPPGPPAPEAGKPPVPPAKPEDKEPKMPINKEKYAKTFEAMDARIGALEAEATNAKRALVLERMRQQHAFDLPGMVEKCNYSKMSAAEFDRTVELLKGYPTVPAGDPAIPTDKAGFDPNRPGATTAQPEKFSAEHYQQALRYAQKHGVSWDEAKAKVLEAAAK